MSYRIRIVALTLILLLACSSFAYADFSAYVASGPVAVYADSDTSKKVGSLPTNAVVTVRSHADGVAKISYKGKTGYADVDKLTAVADDAEKAVVNTASRVYKKASTKSKWSSLKKGTTVNLLSTSGSWAKIERSGTIGYTKTEHLTVGNETSAPPANNNGTSNPSSVVVESFSATVTADQLVVYKSDSNSSKRIGSLKKGASITVRAYNDTWARVENKGVHGYCLRSGLTRKDAAGAIAPGNTPSSSGNDSGSSSAQTIEQAFASGKHSNEELIFLFLTKTMKLNTAAACGILSNIRSESTFKPTAYNSGGGSYGICQWTGSRYTRLKTYCTNNNYEHSSLLGQLYFLKYELENHYGSTLEYMRSVSNSASGAYDAGYYYCYHFEVPANRGSVSVKRGNYARDTYWPKYDT